MPLSSGSKPRVPAATPTQILDDMGTTDIEQRLRKGRGRGKNQVTLGLLMSDPKVRSSRLGSAGSRLFDNTLIGTFL